MSKIDEVLKRAAKRMEVAESDLQNFFSRGEQKTYTAEEWLFHESTPRQWVGIVFDGEVEIVRGCRARGIRISRPQHGRHRHR